MAVGILRHFSKRVIVVTIAILVAASCFSIWLVVSQTKSEATQENTTQSNDADCYVTDGSSISVKEECGSLAMESSESESLSELERLKNNENYLNPRKGLSFAELFRNSESYKGEYVQYQGQVIQVLGESGNWELRVDVTKKGDNDYSYWEDTVYIFSNSQERVIEDDIIEFTALMNGVITYESVLGGDITVPSLTIWEHKLIGRVD